ncbi:omega-6 fatty acid desaturase (delta-12 desaturase) [Rhizoctonia solani AG-1 IB]|uniref:Omega-6 fatty acid desaturase (Delta-12 desaturase) n=1 Tax=Thanatephorus cucumeris (strain AG1-IB / isolate 7/3/14) TaxID=1108050 RepID=A0A0B7FKW9_THACB|nr:omega-6 fatty acid desaturase (delta-12 desaturase) [Rhizoctonia solani AG-1 IB]
MGQRQKAKAAARNAAAAKSRSPSPKLEHDGPEKFIVPELSVKDCLSVIPSHCFERSALRSFSYVGMDFALLGAFYYTASTYIPRINPTELPLDSLIANLPANLQSTAHKLSPHLYSFARFAGWQVYALGAGLVGTGLWIIAHECGHQAFSTSKALNNAVGWALHSALGVPYHSWRISHARHHAATSHCTRDEAYVPRTRSQKGLPSLDYAKEDLAGGRVDEKVQEELVDALGDSPLGAALGVFALLLFGWPLYLIMNISGQKHYPAWTNHFVPKAPLFQPHQYSQILFSDFGIFLWLGTLVWWSMQRGFAEMFRVYFVPYLWVNHWLILITFLQHTDPLLPHYRQSAFTFTRGALSTMDRNLLGGEGFIASITGWLGATLTHGISETHVLHHVCSKIPHYHAWEASRHLKARLARAGYSHEGRPGTWGEVYRVWKECRFIEDEGDVVFYKNARGFAARQAVFANEGMSDSGVDVKEQSE